MKKRNKYIQENTFLENEISAIEAKHEAQKIAFGPIAFQASRCLRDLGILNEISEAGEKGITRDQLRKNLTLNDYAIDVLIEMGLSMEVIKIVKTEKPWHFILGKIGYFLLNDSMTKANMDFVQDVCYLGSFHLQESLENHKPEGLKTFGEWATIYEGLSSLPDKVQKSWFAFDHYYSDGAFPEAFSFVFNPKKKNLLDIGGNTAKWAVFCMEHDPDVKVTIVDLPGQAKVAESRVKDLGYPDRISIHEANVLNNESVLPSGFDSVWMSQFLDCFSLVEITGILRKVYNAIDAGCDVFVMEPLWDKQKYKAATFSLHATSLYFTSMANGNSKMYGTTELVDAIAKAGFNLVDEVHEIGPNDYSILKFRKRR